MATTQATNPATPAPPEKGGKSAETLKKLGEIEKKHGLVGNIPYNHEYWALRNQYMTELADEKLEKEVAAMSAK